MKLYGIVNLPRLKSRASAKLFDFSGASLPLGKGLYIYRYSLDSAISVSYEQKCRIKANSRHTRCTQAAFRASLSFQRLLRVHEVLRSASGTSAKS